MPAVTARSASFALGLLAAWALSVTLAPPPPPPPRAVVIEILDDDDDDDGL